MSEITKAIWKLRPDSEFSFIDEDYSTIKWDKIEGNPPTQTEIDSAINQIKIEEAAAEANAHTAKQTAQAKLESLGLTAEDLKALGL